MVADSAGFDVGNVLIPVTGRLALALDGTTPSGFPLTSAAGASSTLTLPTGFTNMGLFTDDGGFEWTMGPKGDPIYFFQEGYSLPTGEADSELNVILAEHSTPYARLTAGQTPDSNGYFTVDAGGVPVTYPGFTEETFKNGWMRRRQFFCTLTKLKEKRSKRGEVLGGEVTFTLQRRSEFGYKHYGEWNLKLTSGTAPATPTITGISPSGAAAGATITITGTALTGAVQVVVGSSIASNLVVVSDTQVTCTMPAGTAGSTAVTVTTAAGTSPAFAYTRG